MEYPSNEIEQATGQPFRLQPEELRRLAEKAKDMDPNNSERSQYSIPSLPGKASVERSSWTALITSSC